MLSANQIAAYIYLITEVGKQGLNFATLRECKTHA